MKICPEATIQPAAQPGQPRRPALAAARTHPVSQPHSFLAFFYVLFYVVFSKCDIDVHNIQRRHLILIARPPRQQTILWVVFRISSVLSNLPVSEGFAFLAAIAAL